MKIVHLVPGSGNTFYCQNCMRDGALIRALRASGHDVVAAPMYLPLFVDDPNIAGNTPVFYGAINTYLKQTVPFLRNAPRWLEKMLDASFLLKIAARKAGSTQAQGLENMTLSMLQGEEGHQAAELEHLVNWLSAEGKPDIVHLSNALLVGLAGRLKEKLGCKVVCTLQDEDVWINAMEPGQSRVIWQTISEKCDKHVDMLLAVSRYYGDAMQKQLSLPDDKLTVIPIGVAVEDYSISPLSVDPPSIGFLSRMSESLGLGILVDAFIQLKRNPALANTCLAVSGGMVGNDYRFVDGLRKKLARENMEQDVHFVVDFTKETRLAFLQSLTVLSVPVPGGEAFGTHLIEAQACGVPVVQPRVGAYPEIVEKTRGGVLYDPNTPEELAATLKSLLSDPGLLHRLGSRARIAVEESYSLRRMATDMIAVYEGVIAG